MSKCKQAGWKATIAIVGLPHLAYLFIFHLVNMSSCHLMHPPPLSFFVKYLNNVIIIVIIVIFIINILWVSRILWVLSDTT